MGQSVWRVPDQQPLIVQKREINAGIATLVDTIELTNLTRSFERSALVRVGIGLGTGKLFQLGNSLFDLTPLRGG
jgi:hypothetical protein